MKLYVINGPSINMLGIREPEIYGKETYASLLESISKWAKELGLEVTCLQSNVEGEIVNYIQKAYFEKIDGIVINPGAYTHTSVAIHDALEMFNGEKIEVHLSEVDSREDFRKVNFVRSVCTKTFAGKKEMSYVDAVLYLKK